MAFSTEGSVHEIDISLPARYGSSPTLPSISSYLSDVSSLLSSPFARALVANHLNDVAADTSGASPPGIEDLWEWAAFLGEGLEGEGLEAKREEILKDLSLKKLDVESNPPQILLDLLSSLSISSLPRQPLKDSLPTTPAELKAQRKHHQDIKQSPKKIHEVARLSAEIGKIVSETGTTRVVDVGAGQGYLSRSLSNPPWNLDVLALDGADSQTTGAQQILTKTQPVPAWSSSNATSPPPPVESPTPAPTQSKTGSLIHLTTHISSPTSLISSISSWVDATSTSPPAPSDASSTPSSPQPNQPVPILLTGLHACGSLTLAILQTFILLHQQPIQTLALAWHPTSLALVGCCYNLLTPPLTSPSTTRLTPFSRTIIPENLLQPDHLQLAAQDPSTWLDSKRAWRGESRVGVRKMVWRGLVGRELARKSWGGEGRIGKVGARVWKGEGDWEAYRGEVGRRVGVDLAESEVGGKEEAERKKLEFQLGCLHVARCLLGPAIETLLLLDRFLLLVLSLPPPSPTSPRLKISLKPIFDQSTGSLRNMALIVTPSSTNSAL